YSGPDDPPSWRGGGEPRVCERHHLRDWDCFCADDGNRGQRHGRGCRERLGDQPPVRLVVSPLLGRTGALTNSATRYAALAANYLQSPTATEANASSP